MKSWVNGEGPKRARLMIIGEGAGIEEAKQGRPFVGKSGKELDQYLSRIGINRKDVYITNVIKDVKMAEKKEVDEVQVEILKGEIEEVNPDIILTLGAIATHIFLDDEWDMETLNAVPHLIDGRIVIPSFHPAAAFHDTSLMAWIQEAFEKVIDNTTCWTESEPTRISPSQVIATETSRVMAIDTETFRDGRPFMITFSSCEGWAGYIKCSDTDALRSLNNILDTAILHNAIFDLPVLSQLGIRPARWIDTMQMAFLLETLPLSLKGLAYKLCGMKIKSFEDFSLGFDWDVIPMEEGIRYACSHADATLRVYNKLKSMAYDTMPEVLDRDLAIMPMVIQMMKNGMKIDVEYLSKLSVDFQIRNLELLSKIEEISGPGFNPASAPQVSKLLYEQLKLGRRAKIKKTKWGGSTSKESIKRIKDEHPVVQMIEDWRETDTLIDKFLNVLPEKVNSDGRVHTKLSMVRVKHSGRLASSDPNLMAQPVRTDGGQLIRRGFVAPDGYVLASFDYNQIEMRLMAHLSQDPIMIDVYQRGGDIHTETAMRIFKISDPRKVDEMKHRYPAKRTGFGIINSVSARGLMRELEGWKEEDCQHLLDEWFKVYVGVRQFMDQIRDQTILDGKLYDMWGRRELFPEVYAASPYIRDAGLRRAGNHGIQSGAQGIIKEAMRQLWPKIVEWNKRWDDLKGGESVRPLLQIHDDLIFEIHKEAVEWAVPEIKSTMENVVKLSIPITVNAKTGLNWGEMEKY